MTSNTHTHWTYISVVIFLSFISTVMSQYCSGQASYNTCGDCIESYSYGNTGAYSWCTSPQFCFYSGNTVCEAACDGSYHDGLNDDTPCGESSTVSNITSIIIIVIVILGFCCGTAVCCYYSKSSRQLQAENAANAAAAAQNLPAHTVTVQQPYPQQFQGQVYYPAPTGQPVVYGSQAPQPYYGYGQPPQPYYPTVELQQQPQYQPQPQVQPQPGYVIVNGEQVVVATYVKS